mmetsp:Transcript_22766/g.63577  ORF Transcript_22766/g.63577 Transcript_22766/m.63577 type:complete len:108 (-) Transcript_22766:375-698(-)
MPWAQLPLAPGMLAPDKTWGGGVAGRETPPTPPAPPIAVTSEWLGSAGPATVSAAMVDDGCVAAGLNPNVMPIPVARLEAMEAGVMTPGVCPKPCPNGWWRAPIVAV